MHMKSFDPSDYTHGLSPSRQMNHKATSLVCNSVGDTYVNFALIVIFHS